MGYPDTVHADGVVRKRASDARRSQDAIAELMMTVLAQIAKFERALILERQREGIAIAKAKGVYRGGGRP